MNIIRKFLHKFDLVDVLSVEVLSIGMIVGAVVLADIGFICGHSCSSWMMRVSFLTFWILSLCVGVKRMVAFSALMIVALILTAHTYAYTGFDTIQYHAPMQILMMNGWNPVRDSTLESIGKFVCFDHVWAFHCVFLPKFSALCGALVAQAVGLWNASAFLNYILIYSVAISSYRFARTFWDIKPLFCVMFSCMVVFSRHLYFVATGEVDYIVYACFCLVVFDGWLWWRLRKTRDFLIMMFAMVIALSTKSTSAVWVLLFLLAMGMRMYKERAFWVLVLSALLLSLVLGVNPYLTSFYHYASPLYPMHSFSKEVKTFDITNDLALLSSQMDMGFVLRFCYAWVSPEVAIKLQKIFSGLNGSFEGTSCLAGYGVGFRVLVHFSLIMMLVLSRCNFIWKLALFVFLTANIMPLRCIGYFRYCPQVWLIPCVSIFNVLGCFSLNRYRIMKCVRCFLCIVVLGVILFSSQIIISHFVRQIAMEGLRQKQISKLIVESRVWEAHGLTFKNRKPLYDEVLTNSKFGYTFYSRMKVSGIELRVPQGGVNIIESDQYLIPWKSLESMELKDFEKRFNLENKFCRLWSFDWKWLFDNWPSVLWDKIPQREDSSLAWKES